MLRINSTTNNYKILSFFGATDGSTVLTPMFKYSYLRNRQIVIKSIKAEYYAPDDGVTELSQSSPLISSNPALTGNLTPKIDNTSGLRLDPGPGVNVLVQSAQLKINGTSVLFSNEFGDPNSITSADLNKDNLFLLHPEKIQDNGIEWILLMEFAGYNSLGVYAGNYFPNVLLSMDVYLLD